MLVLRDSYSGVQKNFAQSPSCYWDDSCMYSYEYVDSTSINGQVALETLTLTELTGGSTFPVDNFVFGCGWSQNLSVAGVAGIVGLGRGRLSLPSQVSTLYSKVFAYCLVSFSSQTNTTSPLLFGSFDASAISGHALTQTRLVPQRFRSFDSFYFAPMTGVTVNGVDVGIPASNFSFDPVTYQSAVIFDSGTTVTRLSNATIDAIVRVSRTDYFCFLLTRLSRVKYSHNINANSWKIHRGPQHGN